MRQIYPSGMNDESMHMNPVPKRKSIETKEIGIPRRGTDGGDGVDEKKGAVAVRGKGKQHSRGASYKRLGESNGMGAAVEGQGTVSRRCYGDGGR
jgi:hypothetical protein